MKGRCNRMGERKSMREKLSDTIDDVRFFINRVCRKGGTPEEIAVLPALMQAITNMTGMAVIEKKD
jgi:hypothetical protein